MDKRLCQRAWSNEQRTGNVCEMFEYTLLRQDVWPASIQAGGLRLSRLHGGVQVERVRKQDPIFRFHHDSNAQEIARPVLVM